MSIFTLGLVFWFFQLFHSFCNEKGSSKFTVFDTGLQYTVEVLFSQGKYLAYIILLVDRFLNLQFHENRTGSYCYSNSFGVRLLAGVWCLATCVLVYTYNSTLTAHLMVNQRPQPIIKSIFELGNNSNVQILVKKGSGTDFLFSVSILFIFI